MLDGVPVDDGTVGGHQVHPFIDAGMFEVGRSEKLLNGLEGDLVGVVYKFGGFLGDSEIEDFPFFVGFYQIIAPVKLVFDDAFPVLSPEGVGVVFLGFFGVHGPDHGFPFGDGVTLTAVGVDQDHHAALPALHVAEYVFEVGFVFVLVEQVDDFFFEQFPLEHVLNG